jgi:hypothetical chaperone protein
MTTPTAYGIDFGTTNSAIAVATDDDCSLVPVGDGGSIVLPSIIYIDETGNELAGNDAVRQFLVTGPPSARLMSSVKTFLADPSVVETTSPWGTTYSIQELVAILLRHLKRRADQHLGADVRNVVLGHPVIFVNAEGEDVEARQELAIERLAEAAGLAGFDSVAFLDEPTAALMGEDAEGLLMAVDFGGGTFDVSIVELSATHGEVLATQGAAVGGELFDSLLFDAKVAPELGLDREYWDGEQFLPVPAALRPMRTLSGILGMVSDGRVPTALEFMYQCKGGRRLAIIEEIIEGGHAYNFFRSVEDAKIRLSKIESTSITFDRPGIGLDVAVARDEFSTLLEENLCLLDRRIQEAMEEAGVAPDDIDLILRTGGSAQIPAFVELLRATFGEDKLEQRDAFGTVARGLAVQAGESWGGDDGET